MDFPTITPLRYSKDKMSELGVRFICDEYRGWNCWSPHYPIFGLEIQYRRKDTIRSCWKDGYAYTLGVL